MLIYTHADNEITWSVAFLLSRKYDGKNAEATHRHTSVFLVISSFCDNSHGSLFVIKCRIVETWAVLFSDFVVLKSSFNFLSLLVLDLHPWL